jgi:dCMP deaminase
MEEIEKFKKYLLLSDKIASSFSKDSSTKVGAIFLNKDETAPRSFGYNGMPRGLDDTNEERNQRPEKYFWYEHAERNGIYNIAREILEGSIIFSTKFPNMESARAIASSGIKSVVVEYSLQNKYLFNIEDKVMLDRVITLFKETGVKLISINREEIELGVYPDNFLYPVNIEDNTILDFNKEEALKDFKLKSKYLKYLDITLDYANNFSPDRKEKAASMILNEKTLAPIENGFGVNAPPSVLSKISEEMHSDEEKEFWFQESEKNAIFNAVRHKFEGTTAVACWCPCIHCSLAMVSVGLTKVVTRKPDFTQEADYRWKESFERSERLYKTANIEFILLDIPKPTNEIIKNNNKKVKAI